MSDPKTRGDLLYTDKSKVIGKSQIYALLVDANRDAILDASGNEQLADLEIIAGRLQTDAADQDAGVKATAVTMPTGGTGKIGWLSGIYDRLAGVVLAAGAAVIGKVGIDQTTDGTTNRVVSKISQTAGENVVSFNSVSQPVSITGSLANQFETLTVTDTAGGKALTSATYGANTKAVITVETAAIRFRTDGVAAPTATLGHLANVGDTIVLDSASDIANFRAIRSTGVSATIMCSYGV